MLEGFEWFLFALSILLPLVMIGLEWVTKRHLPKSLWRLVLLITVVMAILSVIGLLPRYIQDIQMPHTVVKVVQAIAAVLMIYAFIRTFFPFVDRRNKSD